MAVSEMVERVARELALRVPEAQSWEDCVPMAMAVIAAMREPTNGVIDAGVAGISQSSINIDRYEDRYLADLLWRDMIGAALERSEG